MTKALAYLRVSGKAQIEGGFPRQREAIARYAKAHAVEVVEEFRDEGVSGTKDLDDRTGLGDLMARIRSNGVTRSSPSLACGSSHRLREALGKITGMRLWIGFTFPSVLSRESEEVGGIVGGVVGGGD